MRVLLAGASGALGRLVIPLLQRAGHTVTGLTRRAGTLSGTGSNEIVGDVLERANLLEALAGREFDAVVHHATAMRRHPRSYGQMRATNRLRSEGTSTLIAAARATGATRFVAASAFYGYGLDDFGSTPLTEDAAFGERPGGPVDPVFRALVTNEQQARAFGGVALRLGLVYEGRGDTAPVPSRWRGELPFLHAADAAGATVAALDAPAGSVFNIVDDTPASWFDVQAERARAFSRAEPTKLPAWLMQRAAPFAGELLTGTSMRLSNAAAREQLGWAPVYPSYTDGIAAAAAHPTPADEARPRYTTEPAREREA
jgi:nucleoside-diphosphate-sugar epimerase